MATPEQPRLVPVQQRIFRAAAEPARELGFQLSVLQFGVDVRSGAELGRVLLARGVQGVLLLFPRPVAPLADFPWERFALVEIDYGASPIVHQTVVLDHHQTLVDAVGQLRARGYQRVGFYIEDHRDARILHRWTAAFRSCQLSGGGIGDAPPPRRRGD